MSNGSSLLGGPSVAAVVTTLFVCLLLCSDVVLATFTFSNVTTTNLVTVSAGNTIFTMIDSQGRIVYGANNLLMRIGTNGQSTTLVDVDDATCLSGTIILGITEDTAGNYFLAVGTLYT